MGATVTESKSLTDLQTGDERDVDFCIEAEVGGHGRYRTNAEAARGKTLVHAQTPPHAPDGCLRRPSRP